MNCEFWLTFHTIRRYPSGFTPPRAEVDSVPTDEASLTLSTSDLKAALGERDLVIARLRARLREGDTD
ncbi:hypothetical protein [Nocardia terpenica]|uniref:hypothetical protein n=1 Tax=Nocardia terpenica TaxID=455432 RepID=UPI0002F25089|nr:hypothetical protein [Nocardia terpenica]NQE85928.1 hypothetical protein [Nocardia terpenica]